MAAAGTAASAMDARTIRASRSPLTGMLLLRAVALSGGRPVSPRRPRRGRGHDGGAAIGADGVREARVRALGDVALHTLPVVAVVADLVAPGADRQQAFELLDLGERLLQRDDAV